MCGAVGVALLLFLRPVHVETITAPLLLNGMANSITDEVPRKVGGQAADATRELQQRLYSSSCSGRLRWVASSFAHSAMSSFRMLGTFEMATLMPLVFFSGCELSFWSGAFPLLVPPEQVGLLLTFVGVGEVIGGITMGKLGDILSRKAPAIVGAIAYSVALAISCYMQAVGGSISAKIGDVPVIAFFAAICFGLADSAFNTTCYAMVSQLYGDGVAAAVQVEIGNKEVSVPLQQQETNADEAYRHSEEASSVAFTIFQLVRALY